MKSTFPLARVFYSTAAAALASMAGAWWISNRSQYAGTMMQFLIWFSFLILSPHLTLRLVRAFPATLLVLNCILLAVIVQTAGGSYDNATLVWLVSVIIWDFLLWLPVDVFGTSQPVGVVIVLLAASLADLLGNRIGIYRSACRVGPVGRQNDVPPKSE